MLVNAYCTARNLPPLDFPHRLLGHRDRSDPNLTAHLQGFIGYLSPDTAMTSERYELLRHVQRVTHHLSMEVSQDLPESFAHWLAQARAVAFWPDGSVRDAQGLRLFQPEGQPDPGAKLPVSALAERRKTASQRRLEAEGISVPAHLPTILDEEEVELRSPAEVANRALALFIVALRAESLGSGDPIPVSEIEERQPFGFGALSPLEREFMTSQAPPEQAIVEMSWRYEALQTLLWSLGLCELPPATEIAEVSTLVGMMMEIEEEELTARANLRLPTILLDTLDLHFRYHWAVRQARLEERDPPGGLDAGVVLERHYALNWLVRFEGAEWDDIDTPT